MSKPEAPTLHITLATAQTLPSLTPSDALLRAELEARGARVTVEPWDTISHKPSDGRLVCLRSTWDYQHRPALFKSWIAAWNDTPDVLWNPPATVLWNLDKIYLREFADGGIRTPRTFWFEPGERPDIESFLARNDLTVAVAKPRISASAFGMCLVHADSPSTDAALQPLLATGSLLQEVVPEIYSAGERSLIFIGGRFSHAVHKRAAPGDYRTQSDFGGSVTACTAADDERGFADTVLAAVGHSWVYARVDIVRTRSGPVLMEVELVEPELFLDSSPQAAARLAEELTARATAVSNRRP